MSNINTISNTNYELNYEEQYEALQAIQSREIEDEYYSDYYGSEEYSHIQTMEELKSQGLI